MAPDFVLLPAGADRYEAVFALHEQLFRSHIEQIWGWHPEWQERNFRQNWSSCDTRVIESQGALIGYQQVMDGSDALLLKNLGLLPLHQGRGIGAQLVRSLQSKAASISLPVKLSVFVTNPRAVRFYECLGFRRESRTLEFQHMRWDPMPA